LQLECEKDVLEVEKQMTKQELERCINEYGKDIYSFCRYLAGNRQEADDLYQDTFLLAVERNEAIDYEKNPKGYLLSAALQIWKNRKRKFAWRKRIADVRSVESGGEAERMESGELPAEEKMIRREEDEAVRQAVARLPEKLKVPVLLFYMEELSTAQIAEVLKVPAGTVMSRLYRARKQLQKELEGILDES